MNSVKGLCGVRTPQTKSLTCPHLVFLFFWASSAVVAAAAAPASFPASILLLLLLLLLFVLLLLLLLAMPLLLLLPLLLLMPLLLPLLLVGLLLPRQVEINGDWIRIAANAGPQVCVHPKYAGSPKSARKGTAKEWENK